MLISKLPYAQAADADLFRMVKQSDQEAFREIYNRYWLSLLNATYKRLNSREKAEEIVQRIFIDLYKRRDEIELTASLKLYLDETLKLMIFNEYRSVLLNPGHQQKLFFRPGCKIYFSGPLETRQSLPGQPPFS